MSIFLAASTLLHTLDPSANRVAEDDVQFALTASYWQGSQAAPEQLSLCTIIKQGYGYL